MSVDESEKNFRVNRQKVGLTYSCPVDKIHPIDTKEELLAHLHTLGGLCEWTVATELHKNGKNHYHADIKFSEKLDTKDVRFFDFKDVHPNIIKPGKGWLGYCCKGKDFISNVYAECKFKRAWACASWTEAADLLQREDPKFLLQYGHQAERNWKRRKLAVPTATIYCGPYPQWWYTFMEKHTWGKAMVIKGPPGIHKTQFLKYWTAHDGGYFYAKGKAKDQLRRACGSSYKYLILDDASKMINDLDGDDQNSVLDVENGGDITARNKDVYLPPSRRIIIANRKLEWREDSFPELKRRKVFYSL